ncbi:MAG: nucleotidyltransferase domain-containing protein [PVC group bacterium]
MNDKEIRRCLKKIAERLKKDYHAEKVILFGSYAQGEATRDSDIDILVSAPAKERFFERMATVRRLIRDLRNGLPVSPIILTPDELETRLRMGDQFIQEIVKKGVAL